MTRRPRPLTTAVLLWLALFASPFLMASATCDRRLNLYALAGLATLVAVVALPFLLSQDRPLGARAGVALGFAAVTLVVWYVGGAAADVRILCRLF